MFNQLQRVQKMKTTGKLIWVGILGVELILIGSAQAVDNFPSTVSVQGLIMSSPSTALSGSAKCMAAASGIFS